jgi:hypothetical protein
MVTDVPSSSAATMPQIRLGPYSVSRLITGANTINGGSHLSRFTNLEMLEYFTPERTLAFLRRCEEVGINTWQASVRNAELLRMHREQGGRLQFLSLFRDSDLEEVLATDPIGVAYHGEETDRLYKEGKISHVREQCLRARDRGTLVGVSTHMPAVVELICEQGWEVDFLMCCVYERHRSRDALKQLLGYVPIPDREVYLREDPPRMFAAMRSAPMPCLAFKILAAGRLCDRPETVEEAFRETLTSIKPSDGVIVGMYPKYEDQPAINAEYVRRFST